MKKIYLLFIILLSLIIKIKAQKISIEKENLTLKVVSSSQEYEDYTIPFTVRETHPEKKYTVIIQSNNTGESAAYKFDYLLLKTNQSSDANPLTIEDVNMTGEFIIRVMKNAKSNESFKLNIKAFNSETNVSAEYSFTIKNSLDAAPNASTTGQTTTVNFFPDTANASIQLFTGSNFDFFGDSDFDDFAGELSLHMPDLWQIKISDDNITSLGFNAAISNFNYYSADSSNGRFYTENILLLPNQNRLIPDTTKYVRSIYALNSNTKYETWGFYFQPLLKLTSNKISRVYLTFHTEVLSIITETTFNKKSVRNDTLTITSTDLSNGKVFSSFGGLRPDLIINKKVHGYFGAGLTSYMSYPKKFDFYGQAIFGITTNNPTLENIPAGVSNDRIRVISQSVADDWGGFYLVKARLTEKFTKLNGTVGVEVRGLFPKEIPFVASYLGIQLNLDKFFKD